MGLKDSLLRELKERRDEISEEIAQLSKERDINKVEKDRILKEIESFSGKITEEKEELEYLEQEIKERKETIAYLEYKIRQKEEQIRNYDIDIESNLSILNGLQTEITIKSLGTNKKYEVEFEDGSKLMLSEYELMSTNLCEELQNETLRDLAYKYPISIADIMKLADIARAEILEWVNKGRIPKKIYEELSKNEGPLPKSLYIDRREGKAFAQIHISGIKKKEYGNLEKTSLLKVLEGHPAHIDLRIKYQDSDDITQYIISDGSFSEILNTIKGDEEISLVSKSEPKDCPLLTKGELDIISKLLMDEKSYWIEPGKPGATKSTYSYMGLIWFGDVMTGCERSDLHELFLTKEKANDNILDGKYIIKCIKDEEVPIWNISSKSNKPLDSIMHSDTGHHSLVSANKVDKFGRESSRDDSQRMYRSKLQ